jgi:hypothetical protein
MGLAVLSAWLAGVAVPVHAQNATPNINLLQDLPSKTPEEKEADEARDKAYRESLKKIPDAKVTADPWGAVRAADAPKTPAKSAVPAKPKTKTGSNAN